MTHPDATDLLLHACLARDDAASRAAFERWQQVFDLDDIDGAGFSLLPLLESRLAQLGVEHPWRGRLQGVVRKARLGLALDRAAVQAAHETLRREAIDAALLGASFDLPLLLDEITLFVAPRCARAARDALVTSGVWGERKSGASPWSRRPLQWRSTVVLHDAADRRLTLRWRLLDARPSTRIDEEMCGRASRASRGSLPTLHFDPADLFVQAALRRPTSPRSIATACLARLRCDDGMLDRIRLTAAALDAHDAVAAMLQLCDAIFEGAPLPTPTNSPFARMRETLRRRSAYVALSFIR